MPYKPTGVQALFPVALPRRIGRETRREEYETQIAQNENNLNQNFSILYQKLLELEEILALIGG
ncbi:MAG TPA: hypothetical protein VN366_02285 [Feifaniaceae bacterium]|nr:hypothetical protein [Feifaniaceae bacterium]